MLRRGFLGALGALVALGTGRRRQPSADPSVRRRERAAVAPEVSGRWHRRPSKYKPHQGARECSRRMRQIERGQLSGGLSNRGFVEAAQGVEC